MNIEQIISQGEGTIVDVRSVEEFRGGHVAGSVNIPLQELDRRINEIQHLKTPVILCCASGNRSGQAERYLQHQGIDCYNAGSWYDVNFMQSKKV
jgi:rhodanese-related sulfurtransferase